MKIISQILIIGISLIVLLVGIIVFDSFFYRDTKPGENITNLQEFLQWKESEVRFVGEYSHGNEVFTVYMTPSGRSLPSGPCAYLFDKDGKFIDWTGDMGDFSTVQRKFELMSGNVKKIQKYDEFKAKRSP
jgi:hypothetical protein